MPVRSVDPNDIIGPLAYGTSNYIASTTTYAYTIDFENAATATAPAQSITITQQLDAHLDWRSFRLTGLGFDNLTTTLSGNQAFYAGLLDYSATKGYDVQVTAGVNVVTGVVTWTFQTIDPATGQAPANPQLGLLPVDDATQDGEGFVSYTIRAKSGVQTGDTVAAQAVVIFDTNAPINTPVIIDTIDATAPTSAVAALASQTNATSFEVDWSGTDDAAGSGLATYTIMVSTDGAPAAAWLTATTRTNAIFTGQLGHVYAFTSAATDNAGNVEAPRAAPDASIIVGTNDGASTFAIAATDAAKPEGNAGTTPFTFTVTRSGLTGTAQTLTYAVAGTGANPADATDFGGALPSGTVTFAAGATVATITVLVSGDTTFEPDKTFAVTLSGAAGIMTASAAGTILNDDPSPGTTTPDVYYWTASSGGRWSDTGNWDDSTTGQAPAAIPPGSNDFVYISGPAAGPSQTLTGPGNAQRLTFQGGTTLAGTFNAGIADIGAAGASATVMVSAGTTLNTTYLDIASGALLVTGPGATLTATTGINVGLSYVQNATAALTVSGGGAVQLGALVLGPNSSNGVQVTVDSASSLEIGTAGGAAAGKITVDAGHTLEGYGQVLAPVVDQGTIIADGVLRLGPVTGTGLVRIASGATLSLDGSPGVSTASVAFDGATGTLAIAAIQTNGLSGTTYALNDQGGISGFAPGDRIDLSGVTVTGAIYQATGAASGFLSFYNGATLLGAVNLTGNYAGEHFAVTPDGSGNGDHIVVAGRLDDFNGDGKSDLLLQNDNGAIVIETTTGLASTGGGLVNSPDPSWHVVGTADFNGDGQTDILLQNDNGAVVDYLMNGTTITAGNLLTNPGPTWHVRGTGDFNADGKADLVMQNDDGDIVVEYTNGAAVTGGAFVSSPGPNWTVEGVADFNGDGQPDLLLQNTNGTLVDFLMNGATVAAGYQLLGPNVGYSVAGTGTYNADKDADILLHNDNGAETILYTNGQSAIGASSPIGNPGPSWNTVIGGVDYNGDGSSDLLVENTSGTLVGFTLDATGTVTSAGTLTTAGAGWRATGGPPMQFIDGTGSAATLAGTPGTDEFNFTSFTPGIHTITNFDAASDLIALSAAAIGSYANVQAHEVAYNGGTAIGLSADAAIVIQGVTPDQLSSANFVLR